MADTYKAPIVGKAFQVLRLISKNPEGVKLSHLARDLGFGKSTVFGITSALEANGAIMRDPRSKKYTLGMTLFELGRSAYERIDLKDAARPHMEDLMAETRESVFLGVKNIDHVTILDIVESNQDLKITSPVGTTIPILAGATGKIFLADMNREKAARIVHEKGLPRFTDQSIIDPELYFQELQRVRKKGFATDDEEYISGVRAVAAPIKTADQPMSAIWIVGFKPSMSDKKMTQLVEQTISAANAISRHIKHMRQG
jgi:DNA-binding IclR family transcriptional regulator